MGAAGFRFSAGGIFEALLAGFGRIGHFGVSAVL
jgi:hypothetical protein